MLCGSVTGGIPGSTSMVKAAVAGGAVTGAGAGGTALVTARLDGGGPAAGDMPVIDACGSTGRVSAVAVADVVAAFGAPGSVLEHAASNSSPAMEADQVRSWRPM